MEAVTYSTFRNDLRGYLDRTRDNAEPILVTSKDPSANVVVLNIRDYEAMQETMRIYENPYLFNKLRRAKDAFENGSTSIHELVPDDD